MSAAPAAVLERERTDRPARGGRPAKRAVRRWAWRLFRREWRQQILVLALITTAVAVTTLGGAILTNTPVPPTSTFGTASHQVVLEGDGGSAGLAADIDAVREHFGGVDVIENQDVATGAKGGAQLRAQDPNGLYGHPLLALRSGHWPTGAGQTALTANLASQLGLRVGDVWQAAGHDYAVVGTVENPWNLGDAFALVAPGTLTGPVQATVLFHATADSLAGFVFPQHVQPITPQTPSGIPPAFLVLIFTCLGLVFVGLVSVAGFTVLAQRRQRALGMLASLGATDRDVRRVMVANGTVVGVAGAIAGAVLGLAVWIAYAPGFSASVNHHVSWNQVPWWLIGTAMVLAVVTATLAARRPARDAAQMSVVASLAQRPMPPKPVVRTVWKPVILLTAAPVLLLVSGGIAAGGGGRAQVVVLAALLCEVFGLISVAPVAAGALGTIAGRMPFAARVAFRDVARYRSRSGPALAASTVAVYMAMAVILITAGRFSDSVDYVGPNLPYNALIVAGGSSDVAQGLGPSAPQPTTTSTTSTTSTSTTAAQDQAAATAIGTALGSSDVLPLDIAEAGVGTCSAAHGGGNCRSNGVVYVATPELLRHYGIDPAAISPDTMIITARQRLNQVANLDIIPHRQGPSPDATRPGPFTHPKIQYFAQLPTGTSEPNLVLTQHAVDVLHLGTAADSWLIHTTKPLSDTQAAAARRLAAEHALTIETRNNIPTLNQVLAFASAIGILLALGILATTVGLVRSETAGDLRTLTATGARRRTRRAITAATAGALGLLSSVLGTVVAYVGIVCYFQDALSAQMHNVPVTDVLLIVVGIPAAAAVGGWVFAGREPRSIGRQALE
ncbi:putative ABC transport system permease protein [Catenulispora sp. GP43]|uniref:FtsX-like permease family protein n=1 Tax=Catenulispora sp. GP43 TaxID=3156263 RepID=UPI00351168E5